MTEKRGRAGIYPVYIDQSGDIFVSLMIPSDPAYGGTEPQMGKGRIDDGQTPEDAAVREGEEELGLRRDNMGPVEKLQSQVITGAQASYTIHVYCTQIKDPKAFDEPHYESGWTGLLQIDDAIAKTRTGQRPFLQALKVKYS